MQKRILTQEDFDNNPELADNGLKVGDEIEIPEGDELSNPVTVKSEADINIDASGIVKEEPEVIIPLDRLPQILNNQFNPLASIIHCISKLGQPERLVLYNRLDSIINLDRDKASSGIDVDPAVFEDAIKSL